MGWVKGTFSGYIIGQVLLSRYVIEQVYHQRSLALGKTLERAG